MDFQLRNERSEIFYGKAGLFANFVQVRRPARSGKKLKHRSPDAVLRGLQSVIPSFRETNPRAMARQECLARCRPCYG